MKHQVKIFFAIISLLALFSQAGIAQNSPAGTALKGVVLDNYGRGLSGVTVYVGSSKTAATLSDANGNYSVTAGAGESIVLTHPIFNPVTVKAAGNSLPTVRMLKRYVPVLMNPASFDKSDSTTVINSNFASYKIPLLYEEKSFYKSLGAISTIYTNQLTTTPSPLIAYSFAGRLPGLTAAQTAGWPGLNQNSITASALIGSIPNSGTVGNTSISDNAEITLRVRSLTSSPVTLIDGVQRDIYSLDPETIESVTVMKDALSTILLGQNSQRGIVQITTKKAVAGPPRISFTAQTGFQNPLGLPNNLPSYKYAYLLNEALTNSGSQPAYTSADIQAFKNGTDPIGHPNVNWQDEVLRKNALLNRYSLNVSGGSNVARYVVGLSYLNNNGMFKNIGDNSYNTNVNLNRYIVNTRIDVDVSKNFTVGLQVLGRIEDGNQPGATLSSLVSSLYSTPNGAYPVYNPNGTFGGANNYQTNLYAQLGNSGYITNNTRDLLGNIDMLYKMDNWVKGMYVKGKAYISSVTTGIINRSKTIPVYRAIIDPALKDTSYQRFGNPTDQTNNFSLTNSGQFLYFQGTLGYNRNFGDHGIDAMLMADRFQTIFNYDLPATLTNYAGKAAYSYKNRYFAEGALNYSGYDRYKPGSQFDLFYAAGLGWNIAGENFIKNSLPWMNLFKVRATYGQTGNNSNAGYFVWRRAYNDAFNPYNFGTSFTAQQGNGELGLVNENQQAEKAHKLNVGADVSLFNHHLQLTGEYFRNNLFDLLQIRGRSTAIIGNSYPLENIGKQLYTGSEYTLTYQNNYKGFTYFISGNAAFLQSKMVFSDEIGRKYSYNERTGQPLNMTFGYIAQGLFQTQAEIAASPTTTGYVAQPGDIKYKDLNGDGVIDQFDETAIGTNKPLLNYGLTLGFAFKNFSGSVLFQGVENRITNYNQIEFGGFPPYGTVQEYHQNRWTPETAGTATYPRLTYGFNSNNNAGSTFWLQSSDYLRLKNVDLGYTLPYKITSKARLTAIRIFVNAQNLVTWTSFKRTDPEVMLNGSTYPTQRVINTGINIKF